MVPPKTINSLRLSVNCILHASTNLMGYLSRGHLFTGIFMVLNKMAEALLLLEWGHIRGNMTEVLEQYSCEESEN